MYTVYIWIWPTLQIYNRVALRVHTWLQPYLCFIPIYDSHQCFIPIYVSYLCFIPIYVSSLSMIHPYLCFIPIYVSSLSMCWPGLHSSWRWTLSGETHMHHVFSHIHTCMLARIHTYTHAHAHTNTHTRTNLPSICSRSILASGCCMQHPCDEKLGRV